MHEPHRPYRLPAEVYNTPGTVALITACAHRRQPMFKRDDISRMTIDVLRETATKHGVNLYAYTLMPDHAHVVMAANEHIGIVAFMNEVKAVSARRSWSLGVHRTIWQQSYRDDIVRGELDHEAWDYLRYVFRNPVDKGLVSTWSEYPYSGSMVFGKADIDEIFSNAIFFRMTTKFPR